MSKTFKAIAGPFGGTDEAATHRAFEEFVGGISSAERILRLWNNTYAIPSGFSTNGLTKSQVFERVAKREGIPASHIAAFLSL